MMRECYTEVSPLQGGGGLPNIQVAHLPKNITAKSGVVSNIQDVILPENKFAKGGVLPNIQAALLQRSAAPILSSHKTYSITWISNLNAIKQRAIHVWGVNSICHISDIQEMQ